MNLRYALLLLSAPLVVAFRAPQLRSLVTGLVNTLAGAAPTVGSADGSGPAARFHYPTGVATDAAGNLYVADQSNHVIRKVTPAGVVSTLAGTALSPGQADGTGGAARFNYPYGIAVSAAGTVYVADQYNHTIRRITPGGVVSTWAGTPGRHGHADGPVATALFHMPAGLALDAAGTLYVADQSSHTIRKITAAGMVSTLAGADLVPGRKDSTGTEARFNHPAGVAATAAGIVYVADQENNTIRKITPAGVVTTLAGGLSGYANGRDTARFRQPTGVAVDAAGLVYVADRGNHVLRTVNPTGLVTTLAGPLPAYSPPTLPAPGAANGGGPAARFRHPAGLALDAAGTLYLTDQSNHTVRVVR